MEQKLKFDLFHFLVIWLWGIRIWKHYWWFNYPFSRYGPPKVQKKAQNSPKMTKNWNFRFLTLWLFRLRRNSFYRNSLYISNKVILNKIDPKNHKMKRTRIEKCLKFLFKAPYLIFWRTGFIIYYSWTCCSNSNILVFLTKTFSTRSFALDPEAEFFIL